MTTSSKHAPTPRSDSRARHAPSRLASQSVLRSELLHRYDFVHGFFTRQGGASSAPFDSLNFATHTGDDPSHVQTNFALASDYLGVAPDRIIIFKQVHGVKTHIVPPPLSLGQSEVMQADAMISRDPTIACAVRTADCAPILIADYQSGAVAAVHAGWRGVQQNIAAVAIDKLRQHLASQGAPPPQLIAAVGPHIEQCCFEVDTDVAESLSQLCPGNNVVRPGLLAKPHVNLRKIIHEQLRRAGLSEARIDHVPGCTKHEQGKFFSYRRDGWRSGRLLSAIVARQE